MNQNGTRIVYRVDVHYVLVTR